MSEETEAKGAAVRFPPPFVPLLMLGAGMLLEWLSPLPLAVGVGPMRFVIGGALVVGGLALMALAFGRFRETGQDPAPWETSPELIVNGVYRWTRNPMYVSMGLLQGGLGLLFGSPWPLLLVPVTWWTIFVIAIRHEEVYLADKFGDDYVRYCASVRRWL